MARRLHRRVAFRVRDGRLQLDIPRGLARPVARRDGEDLRVDEVDAVGEHCPQSTGLEHAPLRAPANHQGPEPATIPGRLYLTVKLAVSGAALMSRRVAS